MSQDVSLIQPLPWLFMGLFLLVVGCFGSGAKYPGPIDPDAPEEYTTTESGLKYRILRKSAGKKPLATDTVSVHYEGKLMNGTIFDSSYPRKAPLTFPLTGVVKGWQEGLQLVGEGGMIELEIPPHLGYGQDGAGDAIPPNATLKFQVELIKVR